MATYGAGTTIILVSESADATKVLKDIKAKIKSTITLPKQVKKMKISIVGRPDA
jgi:hypothetical protein